jgi:hypothetical protein
MMIHNVLTLIAQQLNEYMRNELNLSEDMVVVNSLVDLKGDPSMQIENRVCLFLQRIEEEKVAKSGGFQSNPGVAPPVRVSLHLVFAANFPDPNYREALRFISLVLEFFQGHGTFDRSNAPGLPPGLDKLTFELSDLDYQEMNNLWSLIGAKYIPSLVYKVRMLTFSQDMIREDVPSIVKKRSTPGGLAQGMIREGLSGALSGLLDANARKRTSDDEVNGAADSARNEIDNVE